MAGPGDAVGAEHAFADGAKLLHRGLAAAVAAVDAELDAANPAVEGAFQHHVLDAAVEAGAAEMRAVVGAADLQHLARFVDAEIARHSGELVAVEEHEGAVARGRGVEVDALVEAVGPEIVGVDFPDLALLGAGGLERLAVALFEQLGATAVAGHGCIEAVDHSRSRSCATFSERSRRSMCVPSSKLSSAMNLSFAAYFMRTRWATSRWRKAVFCRSALSTASSSWP